MDNGNDPPTHTFFLEFSDEKQKQIGALYGTCELIVFFQCWLMHVCCLSLAALRRVFHESKSSGDTRLQSGSTLSQ